MTSSRLERVNGFKCGETWKGAGWGTADSKCRNYKCLVQDFTQLGSNLLEFRPRRVYSDNRLVWSKRRCDVGGNYDKVFRFLNKGITDGAGW